MARPLPNESNAYYHRYINLVEGANIIHSLEAGRTYVSRLLSSLTDTQWTYRYAPGKWSLKEAWIHVIDTERIFAYRALRISRNDLTPLSGFDQDAYVPYANAEGRTGESIIREYLALREATIEQFRHYTPDMLVRKGTASNHPVSVRALGFMIAGHELHHINVTQDKYLR